MRPPATLHGQMQFMGTRPRRKVGHHQDPLHDEHFVSGERSRFPDAGPEEGDTPGEVHALAPHEERSSVILDVGQEIRRCCDLHTSSLRLTRRDAPEAGRPRGVRL